MNLPSILVIDDEPDNFDVIEALLSCGQGETRAIPNYQLHYADNGEDAIASLDTLCPDLILLDVMMPNLDGIEVCQRIKAMPRWQPVPIIMVTALTAKEDLARCLEAGADDFISKPVNAIELRARIESMLRIKHQYDQLQSFAQLQRDTINMLGRSLQELRGNMTSGLSEDLNASLTSVLGSIGILKTNMHQMKPDKTQHFLDLAHQSVLGLERLMQKFLFYLKLESVERLTTNQDAVAVKPLIEYISTIKAEQFQRSNDLIFELKDLKVPVSYTYLQRLIDELLDNAFRFSEPGTPVIVLCNATEKSFEIRLVDQGCGMTEAQVSSASSSLRFDSDQSELGLGLKIVQKIVEICNGRLEISSIKNKGTKIHINLPIKGHNS